MHTTDFEVTEAEMKELLKEPSDFTYHGNIEGMFVDWSLGPCTDTRDSASLIEAVNAKVLFRRLKGYENWEVVRCSHWGCGWAEHLAFKVKDADGKPTPECRIIMEWASDIQEHVVLDDCMLSSMEHEGFVENIREIAPRLSDDAPGDWDEQVAEWLRRNRPAEADCGTDGSAPYPSREAVNTAVSELGFAEDEDEDA